MFFATTTDIPDTYLSLQRQCVARGKPADHRKVANNTVVHTVEGGYAIRLHNTDVLTAYDDDGRIVLNSGGWRTVTTKARIHGALPRDIYLGSEKGEWRLARRTHRSVNVSPDNPYGETIWTEHWNVGFADGITLEDSEDGLVPVDGTFSDDDAVTATRRAKAKIREDVKAYVAEVRPILEEWQTILKGNGSLSAAAYGDCWYCSLPLAAQADDADASHLHSHLAESYLPVRLLKTACNHDHWLTWVSAGWFDLIDKSLTKYLTKALYADLG
jgi:hypothetical protein